MEGFARPDKPLDLRQLAIAGFFDYRWFAVTETFSTCGKVCGAPIAEPATEAKGRGLPAWR